MKQRHTICWDGRECPVPRGCLERCSRDRIRKVPEHAPAPAEWRCTVIDGAGLVSTRACGAQDGLPVEQRIADRIDEMRQLNGGTLRMPLTIHYTQEEPCA